MKLPMIEKTAARSLTEAAVLQIMYIGQLGQTNLRKLSSELN